MKKIGFVVEGMKCGGCKSKIEKNLIENKAISKVEVDLDNKSVILECLDEVSTVDVKKSIEELGFSIPKSLRL